jgi:hypothetical protein
MNKEKLAELLRNNVELYDLYKDVVNDGEGADGTYEPLDLSFMVIDQYGGEGQGDTYWVIFTVTDNQSKQTGTFKLDGWYASYHGHEFHDYFDFYEVQQVEKTILVWEKKGLA